MKRPLVTVPAVVAVTTLALAGCTSGSAHHAAPSSSSSSTTSSSSSSSSTSSTSSTSSASAPATTSSSATPSAAAHAELAAALRHALVTTRTAQFSSVTDRAGQVVSATGSEQVRDGKPVALAVTETIGTEAKVTLRIVGGKQYVMLPAAHRIGGKPWALISKTSSNADIRQLATIFSSLLGSVGSLNETDFATAATSVAKVGTLTTDGQTLTHYTLTLDPAKLPSSAAGATSSAIAPFPVDLYLDSEGRPALVREAITADGQRTAIQLEYKDYNKPVSISAPPASQTYSR